MANFRAAEHKAKHREVLEAKWAAGYRYAKINREVPKVEVENKPTLRIIIKGTCAFLKLHERNYLRCDSTNCNRK